MNFKKIITSIFFIILFFSFYKGADAAMIQRAPNNLGIVGYWSFNDGAGTKATDSSGNSNTGVFNGAPAWTSGRLGKALSFDGTDDYINCGTSDTLQNQDFTISFWIYPNTQNQAIVTIMDNDHGNTVGFNGWVIQSEDATTNKYYYMGYANGSSYQPAGYLGAGNGIQFTTGSWQHIVYTKSGTTIIGYKNGSSTWTPGAAGSATVTYIAGRPTWIGQWTKNLAENRYFNGKIDEVRVYNRALTAAEVTALYRTGLSVINSSAQNNKITNGLVGLWSFNGQDMDWSQSSAEATDRSGQNNNGDVVGAIPVEGISGQALSFDGSGDAVTTNVDLDSYSSFTVSGWFYPDATGESGIRTGFFGQNDAYETLWDGSTFTLWTSGGSCSTALAPGKWYYITLKYDGTNIYIYKDGIQASFSAGGGSSAYKFNIGGGGIADASGNTFNGKIDEVRAYNRALTPTEITDLYKMGSARLQTNTSQVNKYKDGSLMLLQTFNGPDMDWSQSSAEARDRSGQSNHGDVIGATAVEGVSGQALSFDGVNDYINGTARATTVVNNWTISAWINPRALPQGPSDTGIAVYNGDDAGGYGFGVGDAGASGSKLMGLYGQVVWIDSGYTFPNIDRWYHIVMTRNAGTVYFYVNGVQTPNTSSATPLTVPNYLTIGNQLNSSASPYRYFNGKIDEVRIYSRALSVAEILKLYRGGK